MLIKHGTRVSNGLKSNVNDPADPHHSFSPAIGGGFKIGSLLDEEEGSRRRKHQLEQQSREPSVSFC